MIRGSNEDEWDWRNVHCADRTHSFVEVLIQSNTTVADVLYIAVERDAIVIRRGVYDYNDFGYVDDIALEP